MTYREPKALILFLEIKGGALKSTMLNVLHMSWTRRQAQFAITKS